MDLNMKNRVAIVTGSSQGIGKSIAMGLGKICGGITICSRSMGKLRQTAKEIRELHDIPVLPIQADLTNTEDIERLITDTIKEFKRVDILVNNTGGPPPMVFDETSNEQWQNAFSLLFMSLINCCRGVLPYMKKKRWGRIINMTSAAAKQPMERLLLSNSLRAGILGFTKTLSNEMAQYNILVNAVCPGWTQTKRVDDLVRKLAEKNGKTYKELIEELSRDIPLKRMAQPDEVANLVVFLASEKSSYITGATIQVDGGFIKSVF